MMRRLALCALAALLGLCLSEPAAAQVAGRCQCGWFVDSLWGQLSNIEPLDYLPGTIIADGDCRLTPCEQHCTTEGNIAQGVDLDELVGQQTRGQTYCQQIYSLVTGDIHSEPLYVLSRVPDCEMFFVWGTTAVYTSSTTVLCCQGGNYSPCN